MSEDDYICINVKDVTLEDLKRLLDTVKHFFDVMKTVLECEDGQLKICLYGRLKVGELDE